MIKNVYRFLSLNGHARTCRPWHFARECARYKEATDTARFFLILHSVQGYLLSYLCQSVLSSPF